MQVPFKRSTPAARLRLRLRLRLQITCALLCSSTATGASYADEPTTPLEMTRPLRLSPIVITAVQQSSPLIIIADPKDARQPVPASDAADYLKTIPGFSAIRSGGSNGDPVLRGMFGSRLNLLANDGQMLGACPNRMDAPSSYISPATYDTLIVTKGPQTVLWGPGASAGTVRFVREAERFDEAGVRLHTSALGGSFGRFDTLVDGAAGNSEGYIRIAGNNARSDDYHDGSGDTVASRWHKWNADVALGWTPDSDTSLEVSAGQGDGEARYAGRGMDGTQFARESLGLRFKQTGTGAFDKIEARLYYNYADHIMDNFRLRQPDPTSMMPMPMASQVDRRTLGGRLAATVRWNDVELISGLDALRSEHRKRASRYNMMTGTFTDADQFAWDKDAVMHNAGLFGELTWYVGDHSRMLAGARLDRAMTDDARSPVTSPTAGQTRSDTLPSGFVRYEQDMAGSATTLYAGIGHVQRFPDYWELFSAGIGPAGAANAFDGIRPEKTTQMDLGVQFQGDRFQAWGSAYAGQVRDYILFAYGTTMMGMRISQADNIDARIMGGEAGLAYKFDSHWKGDATVAYAWGKNSSSGAPLPQMPPLEARLGLNYQHGSWSAGALWRLVAEQNRIDVGKGNVVGQDVGSSAGFGVVSLNTACIGDNMEMSAGIDNLFDKTYAEHLNLAGNSAFGYLADPVAINEPGRTLWVKIDLDF